MSATNLEVIETSDPTLFGREPRRSTRRTLAVHRTLGDPDVREVSERMRTSAASADLDASFKVRQLESVTEKLDELLGLPEGWDSYGARSVARTSVEAAFIFLWTTLLPVLPSVVPTSSGGVQLEWHRGGKDIEITFTPSGATTVYSNAELGRELDGPLDTFRDVIERGLRTLS